MMKWSLMWTSIALGQLLLAAVVAPQAKADEAWRKLPLVRDGKLDPAWLFLGYGKMSVDGEALRTDTDARGLGLAVYSAEQFGNCELKVVYRAKEAQSNSGIYIRISDGILKQVGKNHAPGVRMADGQLTPASIEAFKQASDQKIGPWYAVHHGFEVQICESADEFHRSGSIYSLASAKSAPPAGAQGWREMIIRLDGSKVDVSIDGQPVSSYDSANREVPARQQWYEPQREPVRPTTGYIGLQTHDPGDVVYFKEISVRPLRK